MAGLITQLHFREFVVGNVTDRTGHANRFAHGIADCVAAHAQPAIIAGTAQRAKLHVAGGAAGQVIAQRQQQRFAIILVQSFQERFGRGVTVECLRANRAMAFPARYARYDCPREPLWRSAMLGSRCHRAIAHIDANDRRLLFALSTIRFHRRRRHACGFALALSP